MEVCLLRSLFWLDPIILFSSRCEFCTLPSSWMRGTLFPPHTTNRRPRTLTRTPHYFCLRRGRDALVPVLIFQGGFYSIAIKFLFSEEQLGKTVKRKKKLHAKRCVHTTCHTRILTQTEEENEKRLRFASLCETAKSPRRNPKWTGEAKKTWRIDKQPCVEHFGQTRANPRCLKAKVILPLHSKQFDATDSHRATACYSLRQLN